MPNELPNLKGVATKNLVETIGSGSFKASYINWSRTMQLFRDNAPGWMIETQQDANGQVLFQVPVGAEIRFRLIHLDGTTTPWFHQAVMDNRNNSIAFDRITSRDVTDTHRRGSCACLAYTTGLAYELWAKMPLESGYVVAEEQEIAQARSATNSTATPKAEKPTVSIGKSAAAKKPEAGKAEFVSLATKMGLCDKAIEELVGKCKNDFGQGIKTLQSKGEDFVAAQNSKFLAEEY